MVVNLILQRTGFERNYFLLERHMIGSFCSLNCCIVLSKPQNLDVFKKKFFINTEFHFNVFIKIKKQNPLPFHIFLCQNCFENQVINFGWPKQ